MGFDPRWIGPHYRESATVNKESPYRRGALLQHLTMAPDRAGLAELAELAELAGLAGLGVRRHLCWYQPCVGTEPPTVTDYNRTTLPGGVGVQAGPVHPAE